jgi:hypothetical protein
MSSEYDNTNLPIEIRGPKEIIAPVTFTEEKPENVLARFPGLSAQRFSDAQKATLEQKIDPGDIDILPTGELYVSQVRYRRILNNAFGPGGWGLVPTGDFQQDAGTLCREYSLFAEGRFVSSAIGEADFQPNNPRYSKATAAESLKSNALTRCCKDLLVASVLGQAVLRGLEEAERRRGVVSGQGRGHCREEEEALAA